VKGQNSSCMGPFKNARTLVHRTDPLISHAFTSDRQKGNCLDHPGLFMVKPMGVSGVGHTPQTHGAGASGLGEFPSEERKHPQNHPTTREERVSAPRHLRR